VPGLAERVLSGELLSSAPAPRQHPPASICGFGGRLDGLRQEVGHLDAPGVGPPAAVARQEAAAQQQHCLIGEYSGAPWLAACKCSQRLGGDVVRMIEVEPGSGR
jgi:hypothetical protein